MNYLLRELDKRFWFIIKSEAALRETTLRGLILESLIEKITSGYEQKSKEKSRKQANCLFRKMYPEVDWHVHCVHHKDGNPLNNDLSNLEVKKRSEYTKEHNSKSL